MQLTVPIPERQPAVRLPAGVLSWTEDEFFHFCQSNRDLRIERSASGEIIVMSPAGGYSGFRSGEVFWQLRTWAAKDGSGVAFDSSTGFLLPNGAMRSPDAAWVRLSRLAELSHLQKEKFIPLCPDFVIEVASPSDALANLTEKMDEYRNCGVQLAWLILPESLEVQVYAASAVQQLTTPQVISGDPMLPDFALDLTSVWNPPF